MTEPMTPLAERIAALRADYLRALPGRMRAIDAAWRSLAKVAWDPVLLDDLHRMAHGLSGSGKTFGLEAVSDAARVLEQSLKMVIASGRPAATPEQTELDAAVQNLQQVIAAVTAESIILPLAADPGGRANGPVIDDPIPVLIVGADADSARHLATQLHHHHYAVQILASLSELEEAALRHRPAAIITELDMPDGDGAETAARLRQRLDTPLPLVFVSGHADLATRLRAVRAGGSAFFLKPVDIGSLIDKLDSLLAPRAGEPERILIIDDSAALADYYAALLRHAGMIAEIETDPLETLTAIEKITPDLILLDMHMPDCTGLELAAVIRQQPEYVTVPIVFLSAETDITHHLTALGLGADDFLTNPIEPDHLLRAVATRASRARVLRRYMLRDGLTGVLNHTAITERLESEIARARRQGSELSLAILDIDHFKAVNDGFGHQMGDQVLKELARILSVHMRNSDCVGRLGGEEFAVILTDTAPATGQGVLDGLRASFATRTFQRDRRTFQVTFSCGIAGLREGMNTVSLIEAADAAMYAAKKSGRNCTMLAP